MHAALIAMGRAVVTVPIWLTHSAACAALFFFFLGFEFLFLFSFQFFLFSFKFLHFFGFDLLPLILYFSLARMRTLHAPAPLVLTFGH